MDVHPWNSYEKLNELMLKLESALDRMPKGALSGLRLYVHHAKDPKTNYQHPFLTLNLNDTEEEILTFFREKLGIKQNDTSGTLDSVRPEKEAREKELLNSIMEQGGVWAMPICLRGQAQRWIQRGGRLN